MKTFLDKLTKIESFIAGVFIALLSAFVIFDVLSRELFNIGHPWAQKSAVYLMIWAGFLGAALVAQKASHLRPEIGDKLWGEKRKIIFVRIQNLFIILFCTVFLHASFSYVLESYEFGDKSVVLRISLWILQLVIPYTFLSILLRSFYFFVFPEKQLEHKREFGQ